MPHTRRAASHAAPAPLRFPDHAGHAGFFKSGHPAVDVQRGLHEGNGQTGAGPLAEPHPQIQKRLKFEVVKDDPVAGFL